MKRLIYRVDDRFIHGQVIEGWINYYQIPNIIIVNDHIAADICQRLIYESVIPSWAKLSIYSIDEFKQNKQQTDLSKSDTLVILGSINDLYQIQDVLEETSYINIGCIATGAHRFEVNDTVYLNIDELEKLCDISSVHDIFAHKLPWESPVNIKLIINKQKGDA